MPEETTKIVIEFETVNDAFQYHQGEEVGRILRRIAELVEREALLCPGNCTVRDYNGNAVGTWASIKE